MVGGRVDDALAWERLATNLRVERELLEVLDALAPLHVAVFKGGLLTRRLYGDLAARASADNDLAVRRGDAAAALERLLQRGYRALPGLDPRRALTRTGQVALFPEGDVAAVSLDLHVEPFSRNFFAVDEQTIWSRLEEVELHGRRVWTFDASLTLCHMVAHFVQHLLEAEQLRHIGRAWAAWGHTLDPAALRGLAARTCSVEGLEYALGLAEQLGHTEGRAVTVTTARARWALRRFPAGSLLRLRSSVRGLLAVLVVGPGRLPRALRRGFLPEGDELEALYGAGRGVGALWKHWRHRLLD
ncbi:MAG TPA: nucleotidyltransferase family protein [Polyangiaceae bacterium]|nr:nucleotidyltransferase family protein [Polyangiaceae bacterium]